MRVQRRCTKALPEAEKLRRELSALGVKIPSPEAWAKSDEQRALLEGALPSEREVWVLAHMELDVGPRWALGLRGAQRELQKLLRERRRTQESDKAPPGLANPYACPLLKVASTTGGWFGLVSFDGFGGVRPQALDPLDEPQRVHQAALVIATERDRAAAKQRPKDKPPNPRRRPR